MIMYPEPTVLDREDNRLRVCVPAEWTDMQVLAYAQASSPRNTGDGWYICRTGDPALYGDDERLPCSYYTNHVHLTLVEGQS